MTPLSAKRKLLMVRKRIAILEERRRVLELKALGAEAADAERRERYFAIPDVALRRRLIGIDRSLHERLERRRTAEIAYRQAVATQIRADLDDLTSEARFSRWRQGIWWDIGTILWILSGAGWLAYQLPGALAGAAISAVCGWFLVRSRERARPRLIQRGQEALRASQSELGIAQRAEVPPPVFSSAEAESGIAAMPGT
jgi:hypothetical protein